jgi:hypothetical protein
MEVPMSVVSSKVRLAVLLLGLLALSMLGPGAQGGGPSYPYYYNNSWYYQPYSGGGYYYSTYYYAPQQYHYAYYYPSYGNRHVYYYNYHTRRYWGRMDLETGKYSMLAEDKRSGDLAQLLKDKAFPEATALKENIIPGSKDVAMTLPPPLPKENEKEKK